MNKQALARPSDNDPAALLSLCGSCTGLVLKSVPPRETNTMYSDVQPSFRSFASNISGWCNRNILDLRQRADRLRKRVLAKRRLRGQSLHTILSALGIIMGAAAGGLWLNSRAAGLFALVLLLLLASIGRSLQRIASLLRTQPGVPLSPTWSVPRPGTASERNIYISTKAMERLRPWVEDQSSLTEESAKAYCSVLLDTMSILDPKLAGRAGAGDIWS